MKKSGPDVLLLQENNVIIIFSAFPLFFETILENAIVRESTVSVRLSQVKTEPVPVFLHR